MGAEERQSDAAVGDGEGADSELARTLASYEGDASRFSYFRLLYLLERLFPDSPRIGHLGPVRAERIRLRANPSLVFAASDIDGMRFVEFPDKVERVQVDASFLGLYGSTSPLPPHFIEGIALSVFQGGPQPIRELLDVIHHRLLSLVYRCWTKYRHGVGYISGGQDDFTRRLFCTVGRDGFADHSSALNPFYLLRFAPLLATKSRSARGLSVVLDELLGNVGAKIRQFVGHWTLIEKPLRNKLGIQNHQLGSDLTLGRYVFDGSGRFAIELGPLNYDDYLSFLPGGHRRPFLQQIVATFAPGIHDVTLELEVDLEAAPRFQLGSPRASTLSRTAWLAGSGSGSFNISVPLQDEVISDDDDDDDDRGEPPPLEN
jgi:type VI secretion system protein ImpH